MMIPGIIYHPIRRIINYCFIRKYHYQIPFWTKVKYAILGFTPDEYVYNNLDLIESVNAIMCGNDNLATRVVHALSENRMADRIMVVGQDADLEACQRIVEGTQVMTVYKPVEKLATRAAECTISLVKNEPITGEDVTTINDEKYDVPCVKLDPIAVTEQNMNEVIIGSGFHMKEDVYLNVPGKMPK